MSETSRYLSDIDAVVCDLDGGVYWGAHPVAGSPEAIAALREAKVGVVFCTNNAGLSVDDYVAKLEAMGIPSSRDVIVT